MLNGDTALTRTAHAGKRRRNPRLSAAQRSGGVGLWLLRHYARQAAYSRRGSCNRFCFSVGSAEAQTKM